MINSAQRVGCFIAVFYFFAASSFGTTYPEWKNSKFDSSELANPAISGDSADPDGDFRVNLMEYALGLEPLVADKDGTEIVQEGGEYFFEYPEVISISDLTYHLDFSMDLQQWGRMTPNAALRDVLSEENGKRFLSIWNPNVSTTSKRWFTRIFVSIDSGGPNQFLAPTNLTAGADEPLAVNLAWNDNTRLETSTIIERDNGSGFSQVSTLASDLITWQDKDVTGNATYTYRVSAQNSGSSSAFSNEISITLPLDSDGDGLSDQAEISRFNTDPFNADSDGDGMPDGWEVGNGLDPRSDLTGNIDFDVDLDTDGLDNGIEYLLGLNPNSKDSDGNGVEDSLEDTDTDGMPNGWEVSNGLDPTENDADRDEDLDKLTNLEELEVGTYPFNAYSDADTEMDGEEAFPTIGEIADYPRVFESNYAVIDMGTEASHKCVALNNAGKVLASNGAIWSAGTWSAPASTAEGYSAVAFNDSDTIASNLPTGWVQKTYHHEDGPDTTGQEWHTWAWIGGSCLKGPTDNNDTDAISDNSDSHAISINNEGIAIGTMTSPRPYETGDGFQGALQKIPTFGAGESDEAYSALPTSINEAGIIVGYAPIPGDTPVLGRLHAFYLSGSNLLDIGVGFPACVNDKNDVLLGVMEDFTEEPRYLSLYRGGTQTTVNLLTQKAWKQLASSMDGGGRKCFNEKGEMILYSMEFLEPALVRNSVTRRFKDIVAESGWEISTFEQINNLSMILAKATKDNVVHNALLIQIEILKPRLDSEGNETGKIKGVDSLKVAQWEKAWRTESTPYGELVDEFLDKDPDRFYVRVPIVGTAESMSVKISTADSGGNTIDEWEEIEMEVDPNNAGMLKSKSHILVADTPDKTGAGISESSEITPRLHKVALLGKVKFQIQIGTAIAEIELPVPGYKTVTVNAVILRDVPGGAPAASEAYVWNDLVNNVKSAYAQANINISIGSVTVADPPPGVDLADGLALAEPNNIPQEVKALVDALGTASLDDIHIFYVDFITRPLGAAGGGKGFALPDRYFQNTLDRPYIYNAFVGMDEMNYLTTSHELGHLLTNYEHIETPVEVSSEGNARLAKDQRNLMFGGTILNRLWDGTIQDSKRLWNDQIKEIRKNPHAK